MNADKIHDYSLIMDAMPGLSILVDQSGLIVHINSHAQYLSGYPESAMLGTKIENLPFSSSCTVDSQTGQLHTTWFLLDGNTVELVWNSVSIVLDGQKHSLFSTIEHPPSVIQHIEPTLESMDCGFCVIDENAKLIYANKIISKITGYDPSELPGMEISRLLEHFKADYWCKFWNKISKKIYGTLGKITKKTGQTRYLRLKCRKSDWNGTQAIDCLVQDCTLEYENNLEEQNKLATIKLISDITFKLATNPYNKNLLTEQMGILGAHFGLDRIRLVNLIGNDGRYELFFSWISDKHYESKLPESLPNSILAELQELIQNKRHILKHTRDVVFPDTVSSAVSGIKTALLVPIRSRDSLWGVLAFISCAQERDWKEWEIDLCDSFVASLSVIFDSINRLKESLARYETLAETVQNGILVLHGENVIYFNHACQEITGYGRDELLSRSFFDFVHPGDKQKLMDNYRKRQTEQNVKPLETLRIITKDGKEKTLKYWINRDKVDDMDVFIVTFSDVTDLVIAREKALQSSAMIETIISTVHDVLYIKDLQGRFLYFRWPKQEQAGKNFDHYIGRTLHELTPEMNDLETVENYRRQVVETGKPVKFTRSMKLVNWDEPTEYETQVTPLMDNKGEMIGTI
ncbi:MAG: PAS domain S-box protein, partial [Caldiserica bacterium]|nr:PAS domain S-box protein [Caldisericota bacterium]